MDSTWLANPQDADTPSFGDDEIRGTRVEFHDRLTKEHVIGGTTAADGAHKEGSARVYYQTTAPSLRPDAATNLDTNDDGRLWNDSDDKIQRIWDGSAFQLVKAGAYYSDTAPTGVSGAADAGALFVDSDTDALYVWDGSAWSALLPSQTSVEQIVDQGGGSNLRCRVVNIGNWNMDVSPSILVAHGLTFTAIRSIVGVIRNDANDKYYPLSQGPDQGSETPAGMISVWNASDVTLSRFQTGRYDNAGFASPPSSNRGWLTIWYTV